MEIHNNYTKMRILQTFEKFRTQNYVKTPLRVESG